MLGWIRGAAFALALLPVLAAADDPLTPRRVVTAPVLVRSEAPGMRYSGLTRAVQRAALSFTAGGRLVELRARLGRRVAEGELLARLDERPLENGVLEADAAAARAQIRWRQARSELERTERLHLVGARAARELEDARANQQAARIQLRAAQTQLAEAERRLEEAALRAPFSGTVSEVLLQPGEYAGSGSPVVVLSGDSGLEVLFHVPEPTAGEVRLGEPVEVYFPVSKLGPLSASVSSITYVGLEGGGLFPVVAQFREEDGVMAGMAVEIALHGGAKASLLVPVEAIVNPTGRESAVFRVRRGRAQKIRVDVLRLVGDQVAVAGAIKGGDQVIVSGHGVLLDGDPVYTSTPASPAEP